MDFCFDVSVSMSMDINEEKKSMFTLLWDSHAYSGNVNLISIKSLV